MPVNHALAEEFAGLLAQELTYAEFEEVTVGTLLKVSQGGVVPSYVANLRGALFHALKGISEKLQSPPPLHEQGRYFFESLAHEPSVRATQIRQAGGTDIQMGMRSDLDRGIGLDPIFNVWVFYFSPTGERL